jgi:hypothetical protein
MENKRTGTSHVAYLSKQEEMTSTCHHARFHNLTAAVPRSLVGETCNITSTLLGYNSNDDGAEIGYLWAPPDPHGAAGMSRLVSVGNSMTEVRRKDG